MEKTLLIGRLTVMGVLWWAVITLAIGLGYAALCNLTDRSALLDPNALTELITDSLVVAIGGVSGRILWGTRVHRDSGTLGNLDQMPRAVLSDIGFALAFAYFSGAVTLIVGIYGFVKYDSLQLPGGGHFSIFVGLALLFLAYGLKLRSRTCAVLLLVMLLGGLVSKFEQFGDGNHITYAAAPAIGQTLLLIWAYFRGIRGTFMFHRWLLTPAASELSLGEGQ